MGPVTRVHTSIQSLHTGVTRSLQSATCSCDQHRSLRHNASQVHSRYAGVQWLCLGALREKKMLTMCTLLATRIHDVPRHFPRRNTAPLRIRTSHEHTLATNDIVDSIHKARTCSVVFKALHATCSESIDACKAVFYAVHSAPYLRIVYYVLFLCNSFLFLFYFDRLHMEARGTCSAVVKTGSSLRWPEARYIHWHSIPTR